MWFLFSLLSGSFYTIQGLLARHVLKQKKDAWAFSFYFSAIGALVSLPFVMVDPKFSINYLPWLFVILMGLFVVFHNLLNFKASNYISPSVGGSIYKFKLVWVLILGILFSGEVISTSKLLSVLFTVMAGIILIGKFKKPESIKGLIFTLSSTIMYAIVVTIVKNLFGNFNSASITFLIFFIPTIINYIAMPNRVQRITTIYKEDGKLVILACILGGFANLAMNHAYGLADASNVVVTLESFLVITLAGEYIFLKEKEHLWSKIVAVGLSIGAVILISV